MNILDSFLSRGMAPPLPPLRTAPKKSWRKTVAPARHQIREDDNESRKEAQLPLSAITITEKEAPNMDVSSISITNVDRPVKDFNVGDTQLGMASRPEQEIGLQPEHIQLYSEGGIVAQNEGELVNSSSTAEPEPNTSMEPFPDAAECPIGLGSQSPTVMAMNAASLSLPMKKRHSMAEAQMHKDKKRKVRSKLQQNVGMHDKLSPQNVGKMIAPRTQPLAGDNCNELPNNEEFNISNVRMPAYFYVEKTIEMTECPADTGRACRRFPNSHSQMLHTKCPDKKITQHISSERDNNTLKSNQDAGINRNTMKNQEQNLRIPVKSLSGDSDYIRKLESRAVDNKLSVLNPPCVPANSNMNKLLMMSSFLNLPASGAQEKEAQREISKDFLLPTKSNSIRNLMPLSSFLDPEQQVHVSGHVDMDAIHTFASTDAHSVKSKSDILSLSEVNKSSELVGRLVQDTTDKREMKQIRSESLDMILLRESILKKSLLSSHPNPALVSSKGLQLGPSAFQHGPVINRKTMESVETQVMEKNSEHVFLNDCKSSFPLSMDTGVSDVQYAAPFSSLRRRKFRYPSSFISEKKMPQHRDIPLGPECNNVTHLYAQGDNQGNPETSVGHGFSESNIMPKRPGNCSVLRLMGNNVVVNAVRNTPPHNPQARGASRIESRENELPLNLKQFHGVEHKSTFCQADVSNTNNCSMISSQNKIFAEITPGNSSSFMLCSKPLVAANCSMQLAFHEKTTLASNLAYCPPSFNGFSVPKSSTCPAYTCPMALKLPQCKFQADQCKNTSNSVSARVQRLSRKCKNRRRKTFCFDSQKQKGHDANDTVLRRNFEAETATLNLMENRVHLLSDSLVQPPEAKISRSATSFTSPNPLMSHLFGYSVAAGTSGLMFSNFFPSTNCLDTDIATFSGSKALHHHKQYRTKKKAADCIRTHVGFQLNENIRDDGLSEKEFYSGYKPLNQTWGESIGAVKKLSAVTFDEIEKQYPESITPLLSNISACLAGKLESLQLNFSGTAPIENKIYDGVCVTNMNPAELSESYEDDGTFRDFTISGSCFLKSSDMRRIGNASRAGIPQNHQHLNNFSPQWNIVRQPEIAMDASCRGLISTDSLTLLTGRGAMAIGVEKEGQAARKPHTFHDFLQCNGRTISYDGSKSIKPDYKGEQDCVANNMSGHDANNYNAQIINIVDDNLHSEAGMFAQSDQNCMAQPSKWSDREVSSHYPGKEGQ